jgi:peptide-N4-(N-acetyl-beta-glucosaminyl)asparagine amidase
VELHKCTACTAVRRFVRYSSVRTLMQPDHREGRCGEWAHLFYAILRVLGAPVRYVWNSEDHVWVEAWAEDRWVHVDPW